MCTCGPRGECQLLGAAGAREYKGRKLASCPTHQPTEAGTRTIAVTAEEANGSSSVLLIPEGPPRERRRAGRALLLFRGQDGPHEELVQKSKATERLRWRDGRTAARAISLIRCCTPARRARLSSCCACPSRTRRNALTQEGQQVTEACTAGSGCRSVIISRRVQII